MEGYQQLFALIKNPKYVKMRLPKTGRPSELNNTANAGRIVRGRNGRKILPAFLLTILSRHLPSPRYRRKRKSTEITSAQIRKKELCKSRQDDTAGKSSRERQAPAPVCRSQSAAPVIRGIAHSSIRRRADHRTPAESSAAEFSGMVSATAPLEQGIFAPCGSVLTWHK